MSKIIACEPFCVTNRSPYHGNNRLRCAQSLDFLSHNMILTDNFKIIFKVKLYNGVI